MRRFTFKPRKRDWIIAGILLLLMTCLILSGVMMSQYTRHTSAYDDLAAAAKSNGYFTNGWRAKEPSNLYEFEDTTNTFLDDCDKRRGYIGFEDESGKIIIPATLKAARDYFYEGLVSVRFSDDTNGFIHPDGSVAFKTGSDSASRFINGRATIVRLLTSPAGKNELEYGFIDKQGNLIADIQYKYAQSFVGELGNEYALVYKDSFFAPLYNYLTKNDDDPNVLYMAFIPFRTPLFIDKDGNPVPLSEVRTSIKRLEELQH